MPVPAQCDVQEMDVDFYGSNICTVMGVKPDELRPVPQDAQLQGVHV